MKDNRAFVIAEDKIDEFLNQESHSVKDALERFNKYHKKDEESKNEEV